MDILDMIRYKIDESKPKSNMTLNDVDESQNINGRGNGHFDDSFSGIKSVNESMRRALEGQQPSKKALQMARDDGNGDFNLFRGGEMEDNLFDLNEDVYIYPTTKKTQFGGMEEEGAVDLTMNDNFGGDDGFQDDFHDVRSSQNIIFNFFRNNMLKNSRTKSLMI